FPGTAATAALRAGPRTVWADTWGFRRGARTPVATERSPQARCPAPGMVRAGAYACLFSCDDDRRAPSTMPVGDGRPRGQPVSQVDCATACVGNVRQRSLSAHSQ